MKSLVGRYQLLERLGEGGSATVWRALDLSLNVQRAVKLVDRVPGAGGETQASRLHSEAKSMAGLAHPGVVAIHDVGQDGARDFIVMDLIEGPSLAEHLEKQGVMSPPDVVRLGVRILGALEAAHNAGIVHRDVKPGNVLLDQSGQGWLCDFGIALDTASDRLTRTGTALGSLVYMAPEQRRDARGVDARVDQYGLGCTLYEALTLSTPVDLYLAPGQSPRWSAVPESLVPVLRRATAAEPGDRYPSARAMSDALVRALEVKPEPIAETWAPEPRKRPRRNSAAWVGLGVLTVTLVVSWVVVDAINNIRVTPSAAEAAPTPPALGGKWQGTWNGQPGATLRLEGSADGYSGELVVPLGPHQRRSMVQGSWDSATKRLFLKDAAEAVGQGSYVVEVDADGILRGQFRNEVMRDPLPFVLVRTE